MRAKYDKNAFNSISPDLLCHRADPSTLVRGRPHTASLIDDLTITIITVDLINHHLGDYDLTNPASSSIPLGHPYNISFHPPQSVTLYFVLMFGK